MLTVRQMLDIALRHATRMADAMVAACVAWHVARGEPLEVPAPRERPALSRGARPVEDVDWQRMVEGNSDTRRTHC